MEEERQARLPQAARDHYNSCTRTIVECPRFCYLIFEYLIGNTDKIPKRLAEAP